jgi:hypothetical protein
LSIGFDVQWSEIYNLADHGSAPAAQGVYVIGVYTGSATLPAVGTPCEDKFLGHNFPKDLEEKYVGRAIRRNTLRARLGVHARGNGNTHVRDHLAEHGPRSLAFIYTQEADLNPILEHQLLTGTDLFPWNKRRDEGSVLDAYGKKIYDEMPEHQRKQFENGPY